MQEASEKMRANTQTSNKFIDTLIAQWMKRTESNTAPISQHQMEEQAVENPSTQEANKQQILRNHECLIQNLKQKLKRSQEAEVSLSACLEVELRNKEDFQTKLNATWEAIETITEYFNYISETLASFQQHRANLSSLYDNVILKQQDTLQKLQSKMKDLENQIAHLRSRSLFLEERLQEATVEENRLRKQLENFEYELQLQKKELANTYAQEKQKLVKEQQRLLQEYESRLQTVEKEKCDIAKLAAQLENKLQIQEENMQKTLTEQNKWRKQMEDTKREFCSQKNAIANAHAEEKKILVEKQQRLLSEYEDLQSQLKMMEQNKSNTAEIITQKDVLLSKLEDENSTYKNQIEVMMANNNEILSKYEALVDEQNIYEKELNAKSEKIQNMEMIVNAIKQRESNLINDVNRFEKKLTNETDYSKNLENKLSNMQKELKLAQEQNDEIQKTFEKIKTTNEQDNVELQQRLKTLHKEKEDVIKRENMRIENAEILSKNMQVKHDREVSALKSSHEMKLLELKRTIDRLNEMTNDIKKEKSVLNMTLTEVRAHNSKLNNNYESLVERNEELQGRLREATEALQMRSIEDRKELKDKPDKMEEQKQPTAQSKSQEKNTKRKYRIRFDPDIMEISEAGHCNVSTSVDLNDDKDDKQPSSQPLLRAHSIERESQKEQEAEVTSVGRKFFKSCPGFSSQRTYAKRRRNIFY